MNFGCLRGIIATSQRALNLVELFKATKSDHDGRAEAAAAWRRGLAESTSRRSPPSKTLVQLYYPIRFTKHDHLEAMTPRRRANFHSGQQARLQSNWITKTRSKKVAACIDTLLLCTLGLGITVAFGLQIMQQNPLGITAVVFPPWTTAAEAIVKATAAGSSLIKMGSVPFVVVVLPSSPRFAEAVRKDGGWLLLDADKTVGCVVAVRRPI